MSNAKSFFETYSNTFDTSKEVKVIEIGSQDVNGSYVKYAQMGSSTSALTFNQPKVWTLFWMILTACLLKTIRLTLFYLAPALNIRKCSGWSFWRLLEF